MNLLAAVVLILLPPSVYADLPSPVEFRRDIDNNSVVSPHIQFFGPIAGGVRGARNLQTNTTCNDFRSTDEFFQALDDLWQSEDVISECGSTGCDWDFSVALANGKFREVSNICRKAGGVMYAYDAHIICDDEESHEFQWHPFYCIAVDDCSVKVLEETMLTEAPANLFIENGDDLECSWESLTVHTVEEEPLEESCSDFRSNDEFLLAIEDLWQSNDVMSECDSTGCNWDFSVALANGKFREASRLCHEAGGVMYAYDANIICNGEESHEYLWYPFYCIAVDDCSAKVLEETMLTEAPANLFIENGDDLECSWESLTVHTVEEESPHMCADAASEEYYSALAHAFQDYYEDSTSSSECNTHTKCWDFSEFISDGAFNMPRSICNEAGGAMYAFDAEINCDNGSSFLFHSNHLGCYSTCSEHLLETYTPIGTPASLFVGFYDGTKCSWDSLTVYEVKGEGQGNGGIDGNDGGSPPKRPKMTKSAKTPKTAKKAKSSKCPKAKKRSRNLRSLGSISTATDILNGEEACENNGYNKNECLSVGCCHWNDWEFDDGECFSDIGRDLCYIDDEPNACE